MDNYERARAVLTAQKPALLRIADELLAREVLDADQVLRLARGESLEDSAPSPTPVQGEPRREMPERPGILPSYGKPVAQE